MTAVIPDDTTERGWERLKAEWLATGRYVRDHASPGFRVDGRVMTCVEMHALLFWASFDADHAIDRLIRFMRET